MTLGHLSLLSDHGYILIAIQLEERDLTTFTVMRTGIQREVSMLIPLPKSKQTPERYRQRKAAGDLEVS